MVHDFIDSIDITTTGKEGWEAFNKLQGKYKKPSTVKPLLTDPKNTEQYTNNTVEQANTLGSHYHNISSDNNLSPEFLKKRAAFLALTKDQRFTTIRKTQTQHTTVPLQ